MENKIYITAMVSPQYVQMTLDDFLFGEFKQPAERNMGVATTKTVRTEHLSERLLNSINLNRLVGCLASFNQKHADLRSKDRHSLYHTFYIPKKSGGMRKIDAPNPELMEALRELKLLLETEFHALYHTSAYAYVKKRSTLHAIQKHQKNESKWFAKLDLSNFFGSTTLSYVMKMLAVIFPFCEVIRNERGRQELETALSLAFLDGVLPQGTPISPMLTNLMMIPVDFSLTKKLRDFEQQSFVYTRYADDFTISSRYDFDIRKVEDLIISTLAEFDAPFSVNQKKTRYGSSSGKNWNLGLMLNKDNEITVGHKRKAQFQSMLHNFIMSVNSGTPWSVGEIQYVMGIHSYISGIEPEAAARIVSYVNAKHGNIDVLKLMKANL